MKSAETFSTGALARAAGVHLETVRFYEKRGLLAAPERNGAGYRQYPAEAVAQVRFIRRAQELGFSLAEVGELLALRGNRRAGRGAVKRLAKEKLGEIDRKIRDLRRMRTALAAVTERCDGRGDTGACPILAALDGRER